MKNLVNIFIAVLVFIILGCLIFGCSYNRMYEGLENKDTNTYCGLITEEDKCGKDDKCMWKEKCIPKCDTYMTEGDCNMDMCMWADGKCQMKKEEPKVEGFSNLFQ